jgi:magnesium transporter
MAQPEAMQRLEEIIERINESTDPESSLFIALKDFRDADVADAFPHIKRAFHLPIFNSFDDERAAQIMAELDDIFAIEILRELEPERIAIILNNLPPDEGADVIAMSEEEEQPGILDHVDDALADQIRDLATYEPESAGGIMTSHFFSVEGKEHVRAVLLKVKTSDEAETINYIYVVDKTGWLLGVASVRQLLQADLNQPIHEIMESDVISVPVDMDQEDVFRVANKYHFSSLPVLDEEGILKGIITFDDLMEVMEDESSEDMYRMAGEVALHPTQQPIWKRIMARFPWLMVTLAGTFFAAGIIRIFEAVWKQGSELAVETSIWEKLSAAFTKIEPGETWTFLICFLPMIGGMAGNVGLQSSTVMVRGFATGEVEPEFFIRILFKELIIAGVIGIMSGLIIGGAIAAIYDNGDHMGFVVGLSLFSAIFSAAFLGTLTPFLCQTMKVDPAYASGPLLTTLNDIFGFLIYFGIAGLLLR